MCVRTLPGDDFGAAAFAGKAALKSWEKRDKRRAGIHPARLSPASSNFIGGGLQVRARAFIFGPAL
ncbi:MAG: hypothetical protein PHY92_01075 [Alphaproteobacteria bacterium]|nr:hypothetical protein [Alphaproteobacteria bacterium]